MSRNLTALFLKVVYYWSMVLLLEGLMLPSDSGSHRFQVCWVCANVDWQVGRENFLLVCARYCTLSQSIRDEPWWKHKDQRAWPRLKTGAGALRACTNKSTLLVKSSPAPTRGWLFTFSNNKDRSFVPAGKKSFFSSLLLLIRVHSVLYSLHSRWP